jgi:hypothetical protein
MSRAIVGALAAFAAASALAGVTPRGQFAGTIQESYESFQNYLNDPDFYMDNPTTIFGGQATIGGGSGGSVMVVYEPAAGATFGLGYYGMAQVKDGSKGHGVNTGFPAATIDIIFNSPQGSFGGWWGAADIYGYQTVPIKFEFYDANNNLIDSYTIQYGDNQGQGRLMWAGWDIDPPAKRVSYTGDYVVHDFLQAIPEPGALALLVVGALALRRR